MGFWSNAGGLVGSAFGGPLGGVVGGLVGSALDGSSKPKETQMDKYAAYKIQQEKEWDAMFGPMEQNLVNHYMSLTPGSYISQQNEHIEEAYRISKNRLQQDLAARGLSIDGGTSLAATNELLSQLATTKADLYRQADEYIAKQQTQFYTQMQAGRPNASGIVQAAESARLANQKYYDKQEQAGLASAIDLGTQIGKQFGLFSTSNPLSTSLAHESTHLSKG